MRSDSGVCIVTGGAGFIGCAISAELNKRFGRVIVLDNLHPQVHVSRTRPDALHANAELHLMDITDITAWDRVLADCRPDMLIHLAAETGTGQSLVEARRHADTNVNGTAIMLDALLRNEAVPKRVVLTSSRAIYGEGAWRSSTDGRLFHPGPRNRDQLAAGRWDFDGTPVAMDARTTRPAPVSVYGATKLAQEHILSSWCNAVGTELTILRLQNVFGPGQSLINPYTGIVALFCQLSRRGNSAPLFEDGMMLRDFVLIDDVVDALISAVGHNDVAGSIFDIGGGIPTTIFSLATQISQLYGAPPPHISAEYRYGDVRHAFCALDATTASLRWKPRFSLERGLTAVIAWIDAQQKLP